MATWKEFLVSPSTLSGEAQGSWIYRLRPVDEETEAQREGGNPISRFRAGLLPASLSSVPGISWASSQYRVTQQRKAQDSVAKGGHPLFRMQIRAV